MAELERERDEKEVARRERDSFATRIRDLEAELEEKTIALEEKTAEILAKSMELSAKSAELATRSTELTAKSAELTAKNAELTTLGSEVAGEQGAELAELEERLAERGQEIRRLERDLAEAERIGRELVGEVRMQAETALAGASSAELDALAQRLATAEADREALSWVVSIRGSS
jgi:chromosome segregation ATPase